MRYFTRGWANGDLDDAEFEHAGVAYDQRLAAIVPRLPAALQELARTSLHDAILERVRWNPTARRLQVSFVAGLQQSAPITVGATYEGAMLGERRIEALRNAARDREATVLYDEIDLAEEGHFVHRLLFWPREEVTIDFAALRLEVVPRADSRVELGAAFVEIWPEGEESRGS